MIANIILSLPNKLYDRMKEHPEIRWSRVIKKAIVKYLEAIESEISIERLAKSLSDVVDDLKSIPNEKVVEHYREMVKAEWERLYTIQTG